ncbi:unsaturated chondroitin disaccharide hydrolase [Amphibacillus marinus]|uniref:Unsaturated chondroitin disaccharide hydrolase n=1 Tax=Amphibacillus marinus TaxID=872970 RepID=A0A1H8IQX7_9BACI|nr:glycoside hydrolase family 88 protein [Amphibacillus marinus]SEN70407.1 unsaturated chondroitin disaccharide hydrolase [Amphibacillus marinus]
MTKTYQLVIDRLLDKTKQNISRFGDEFPHTSLNGSYQLNPNTNWTNGFWSGILWLSYQYSKDQDFYKAAVRTTDLMRERLERNHGLDTHDIGFLYTPSVVAQAMIEGGANVKAEGLRAADRLMKRYREDIGIIQAWGPLKDSTQGGRIIIDCLMNMPLLFWASEQTGNRRYKNVATQFVELARRYLMRGDDSSYHTFYFNQDNGQPIGGATQQGYQDGSTWTRGQAWAIYGFALAYHYTKDPAHLETSLRATRYFIKHLPSNKVAYWDFDAPINADIKPDSSASAIAACGFHELLDILPSEHPDRGSIEQVLTESMETLINDYQTPDDAEGLLDHGSYSVRENKSPDDFTIWGDYFFLEALLRLTKDYRGFWYEK